MTVSVGSLRDTHGAGRLGVHVRANIHNELAGRGIGHFPAEIPDNQDQPVRVYKKGTPAGELIDAVLRPGNGQDKKIRDAVQSDAQRILEKIRELVEP